MYRCALEGVIVQQVATKPLCWRKKEISTLLRSMSHICQDEAVARTVLSSIKARVINLRTERKATPDVRWELELAMDDPLLHYAVALDGTLREAWRL